MAQKKNPYRFTIKFDPCNPKHVQAVIVLNRKHRQIADYIAELIVSSDTDATLENTVENIVKRLLKNPAISSTSSLDETSNDDSIMDDLEAFRR